MNRLIIAGAVALALVAGIFFWQGWGDPGSEAGLPAPGSAAAQESSADIDTSGIIEMTLGPDDAPVTVIEYASFTCPHCATFHENQLRRLKSEYVEAGKVQFIYRDVFFDPYGLWASLLARCGGEERFFGITDLLYQQQAEWFASANDEMEIGNNLRRIGRVAGLGEDQIEACLSDEDKALALVAWYQANAEKHDVRSTPTLIINGQKYGNMSFGELSGIIDAILAEG